MTENNDGEESWSIEDMLLYTEEAELVGHHAGSGIPHAVPGNFHEMVGEFFPSSGTM